MAFTLTSTTFEQGQPIPERYTCEGDDISPPLAWRAPPAGTKSFALIADDPDAPLGTWVHWVMWNIPATESGFAENIPKKERLPNGALQGMTDFRRVGYGGPCPPSGTHRYFFKLYALDAALALSPNATKPQLLAAVHGHVLAQAELMGTYQRLH